MISRGIGKLNNRKIKWMGSAQVRLVDDIRRGDPSMDSYNLGRSLLVARLYHLQWTHSPLLNSYYIVDV